jgi:hypothetical protein
MNDVMGMSPTDAFAMILKMAPAQLQTPLKLAEPLIEMYLADPQKYNSQITALVQKFAPQLGGALKDKLMELVNKIKGGRNDVVPLPVMQAIMKVVTENAPETMRELQIMGTYVDFDLSATLRKPLPPAFLDKLGAILDESAGNVQEAEPADEEAGESNYLYGYGHGYPYGHGYGYGSHGYGHGYPYAGHGYGYGHGYTGHGYGHGYGHGAYGHGYGHGATYGHGYGHGAYGHGYGHGYGHYDQEQQ